MVAQPFWGREPAFRWVLPGVYKKQRNLLTEEWKKSELNVALSAFEIKKAVSLVFYNQLYWKEKETLLKEAYQLYSEFSEKAKLRLKAGESNLLEKTTADNQKAAIDIQLKQVQEEVRQSELQLQYLLNSTQNLIVQDEALYLESIQDSENPIITILKQQVVVAENRTEVEKSKLLPGLSLAYNLNSFKGLGPDDKLYTGTPQFHSVQLGVSLPIFSSAQKARIDASKLAQNIAENDVQNAEFSFKNKQEQAYNLYQSNLKIVQQYQSTELKNADVITETSKKQFLNGEINYLEFVMLINQAIALKSNYTDAVWKLNESAILLNYLSLN